MLVVNSAYLGAYPSVGVNAAWAGIAAAMLVRLWWRGENAPMRMANKRSRPNLPQRLQLTYAALKNKRRELALVLQQVQKEQNRAKRR